MFRGFSIIIFLALFLVVGPSSQGTNKVQEGFPPIISYLNKDNINLVVVDLDNTLMATVQSLTQDPWRKSLIKHLEKKGFSPKQAQDKAEKIWKYLQTVEEVRPMEEQISKVLEQLQNSQIKLIGLSSREPSQTSQTQQQLSSLGMDLSKTAVPAKSAQVGGLSGVKYIGGILYTGSQTDAGLALSKFLNEVNFLPQALTYVDDSQERIQSVKQAIKKLPGIFFMGIHYKGLPALEAENAPALNRAQENFLKECLNMPKVQKILNAP